MLVWKKVNSCISWWFLGIWLLNFRILAVKCQVCGGFGSTQKDISEGATKSDLNTRLKTNIAMENPPFWWYLPGKMVIFMGYVSFREGNCYPGKNISHHWERKIIFKCTFWRGYLSFLGDKSMEIPGTLKDVGPPATPYHYTMTLEKSPTKGLVRFEKRHRTWIQQLQYTPEN